MHEIFLQKKVPDSKVNVTTEYQFIDWIALIFFKLTFLFYLQIPLLRRTCSRMPLTWNQQVANVLLTQRKRKDA